MRSRLRMKRNRVIVKEPHLQSQAALVLLTRNLRDEELESWFAFRDEILNERPLVCYYCGRKDLVKEIKDMSSRRQLNILATIDHVTPISKGGKKFEKSNCVVACFPCNQKKADNEL